MAVERPSGECVGELLAWGARGLPAREGLPDPRREALWLLSRAWGVDETRLRLDPRLPVPAEVAGRFREWVRRRAGGEPAHHLTGLCPFWGREFLVGPAVLIPRPETELLVEAALRADLPAAARVADVGTGSGCLAITLALERPGWRLAATELSPAALAVARANVERLGARVGLVWCDLASALAGGFHLVVANLPYVPTEALGSLPVEVRHDPRRALDGGADGLALVRRLVADLPRLLAPGGLALLELGEDQAGEVEALAADRGLTPRGRLRDLGGWDRVVMLGAS